MKTILVTGSNGQLGQELQALSAQYPQYHFFHFSRQELNIADAAQVKEAFIKIKPQFCVNCAAFTAVDKAETAPEAAFLINESGVDNLAAACSLAGAKLIHISTDYVFDGSGSVPYREDDATNPLGVYGASKLAGEKAILGRLPESVIIRTSWVYSIYGSNFVKTMVRLMHEKPSLNVVSDQWGSPTHAADLAAAIMHIIEAAQWTPGIYNFSNDGVTNWHQFAEAIRSAIGSACTVSPIATEQYPTPAARPKYSVLSKEKITDTFGMTLLPWQQSLDECLKKLAL